MYCVVDLSIKVKVQIVLCSEEKFAAVRIHSYINCNVINSFHIFSPLTTDTKKSASELQEEQQILSEIMRTVEKRDTLVSILEEQRLKERAEDRDLESLVLSKGYDFHWAQKDDG